MGELKVAIHQPHYFPYPGYIHKMMSSDIFVYLDIVPFEKNGLQNRNKIKTSQGEMWLTLPIKHNFGQTIKEVKVVDPHRTLKNHFKSLLANYGRSLGFKRWHDSVYSFMNDSEVSDSMCEINIASVGLLSKMLGIKPPLSTMLSTRASMIDGIGGQGSDLVLSICKKLNATHYLMGRGGLDYVKHDDFKKAGIEIWVQTWGAPVYEQLFPGIGFVPNLSTLDLVFNCPDDTLSLIEKGGGWGRWENV